MARDRETVGPPPARVQVSELDGRVSLFDPATAEVLVLNDTASAVWRLADGTLAVEDIVAQLAPVFGVTPAVIREDVETLIADLHRRGLLGEPGAATRSCG